MTPSEIVAGQVFGRWTTISPAETRVTPCGSRKPHWRCRCACGTEADVGCAPLISGWSRSCGCLQRETATHLKTTHGGRNSLLYDVWTQMLQRCTNQKNKRYVRYGGRGIRVCQEWHDFGVFQAWAMANGYCAGLQIDREKNGGNYEPGNCRWVPNKVNSRNTDKAIRVEWEGSTASLNELAERHGLKTATVYSRSQLKGWTLRQALGLDAPPPLQRPPISEITRQRMRESALVREAQKREVA